MITGAHFLLYSKDAHADRLFLRDVLGFQGVDAGDDLRSSLTSLQAKGAVATEIEPEEWGIRTTIKLPSGGEIGLYQPTHPTALQTGGQRGPGC